jgi:RNA polymerase sigma-70 factor (ECF subfamily)
MQFPNDAARTAAFDELVRTHKRELLIHCYRMMGSATEAEDIVQETFLRAWRALEQQEEDGRSRPWLYAIATNRCLSALHKRRRADMPSGLFAPSNDSESPPQPIESGTNWLQPFPHPSNGSRTALQDPQLSKAIQQEDLRLALIASFQILTPLQRAVLILREVLQFEAREVGQMLGLSPAAVKSALQRARGRLATTAPSRDDFLEPGSATARRYLDRYIAAFESGDANRLRGLLIDDVVMEATPQSTWFRGLKHCIPFLQAHIVGAPGDWRMFPTLANGTTAIVAYRRGPDDAMAAYGVVVLEAVPQGISRIATFAEPRLVDIFGFPMELPTSGDMASLQMGATFPSVSQTPESQPEANR